MAPSAQPHTLLPSLSTTFFIFTFLLPLLLRASPTPITVENPSDHPSCQSKPADVYAATKAVMCGDAHPEKMVHGNDLCYQDRAVNKGDLLSGDILAHSKPVTWIVHCSLNTTTTNNYKPAGDCMWSCLWCDACVQAGKNNTEVGKWGECDDNHIPGDAYNGCVDAAAWGRDTTSGGSSLGGNGGGGFGGSGGGNT